MAIDQYLKTVDESIKNSVISLQDIEIDDKNDEGCNGYVFFGNHKVFRCRVAVKYYYYGENAHEEVSLIKNILHPNILKVWDAHTVEDGWAYFITDEQRKGNIDNLLYKDSLDTSTALHIIRGVLSGVGALHAAPNYLLHRDLKPANILIDESKLPIIADFGSIKRMPENCTKVVASKHSALYRPPESCEHGMYYFSSDIYQIGILLYQLLGGYLPYDVTAYMTNAQLKQYHGIGDRCERSLFEDKCLFDKIKKGKLLRYSTLPYYIDKRIIQIIRKATNPQLGKRFNNIAEFQLALHQIGSLPNWKKQKDMLLCKHQDLTYRIVKNRKAQFIIEKKYSNNRWSKLRSSSIFDDELLAIKHLCNYL